MDCSPPIHEIFLVRILEHVDIFSFRGSSQPRNQIRTFCFSCIAGGFFTTKPPGKPHRHLSSNKYPIKCDRGRALSELWSLGRAYISENKWNVLSVGELWFNKAVELEYGQSCWSWVWKPSFEPCYALVEKDMATHSSTLAWKIPWREGPGRLQSMGSQRVDMTEWLYFHFSLSSIGEGNGNPLQYSHLENPRDRAAWWAAVYGVAQSWTQLMWPSSSSSSSSSSCSCVKMKMSYQLLGSQYFNFCSASGFLQLMDINEIILMNIITLVVVLLCFMYKNPLNHFWKFIETPLFSRDQSVSAKWSLIPRHLSLQALHYLSSSGSYRETLLNLLLLLLSHFSHVQLCETR